MVLLTLTIPILYYNGRFKSTNRLHLDLASVSVIGSLLLIIFLLPGKGQFYAKLFKTGTGHQSVILETSDSVLAITLDSKSQAPNMLWIGGEVNSLYPSDSTYESRALMCAGASQPKRILVIGMCGGISARFFQSMESVEEIVIVELMEGIDDLLSENVDFSHHVFNDPRVHYTVNDGRRY